MVHISKDQVLSVGTESVVGTPVTPDTLYGFQSCSLMKKQNLNINTENDGERLLDTNISRGAISIMGDVSGIGSIYILDRFLRYILSSPTTAGTKNTFNAETGEPESATFEVTKGNFASRFS